jgi:hypothetical protein
MEVLLKELNASYKDSLERSCSLHPDLYEEFQFFTKLNQNVYKSIFIDINTLLHEEIRIRMYYWTLGRFGGLQFKDKLEYYSSLSLQDFKVLGLELPYDIHEVFLLVLRRAHGLVEYT